ncbi:hypothetical protein VNO80_14823 [Phaseolus coccineus]|uniref:Uncharacterized protein n=1 Tax=Phaseolus coccineus TaxID=3886 RepID=A0AAN9R2A4_PHACN
MYLKFDQNINSHIAVSDRYFSFLVAFYYNIFVSLSGHLSINYAVYFVFYSRNAAYDSSIWIISCVN